MKYILFFLMAFLVNNIVMAQSTGKAIYISGNAMTGDTVSIELSDRYTGENNYPAFKRRLVKQVCTNGTYTAKFENVHGPAYFSIFKQPRNREAYIIRYLIMPGDSVYVQLEQNGNTYFTGRGSEALSCRFSMDSARLKANTYKATIYPNTYLRRKELILYLQSELPRIDSGTKAEKEILEQRKEHLTSQQFQVFQADILGGAADRKYATYISALAYVPKNINEDSTNKILQAIEKFRAQNVFIKENNLPDTILSLSGKYIEAVIDIAFLEERITGTKPGYQLIIDKYNGSFRDQLLTIYLHSKSSRIKSVDSVMRSSLKIINTDYWRGAIEFTLSNFLRGVTAYDFSLENTKGKMIKLSDFKGKKVVIDYWFTGCSGCSQFYTTALKEVEKKYSSDAAVVFISVSGDADRKTWLESIKKDIYTSSTAINLKLADMGSDNPFLVKYGIFVAPTFIIIDGNGKIFFNGSPPRDTTALSELINAK